jgi:hypothetical protein
MRQARPFQITAGAEAGSASVSRSVAYAPLCRHITISPCPVPRKTLSQGVVLNLLGHRRHVAHEPAAHAPTTHRRRHSQTQPQGHQQQHADHRQRPKDKTGPPAQEGDHQVRAPFRNQTSCTPPRQAGDAFVGCRWALPSAPPRLPLTRPSSHQGDHQGRTVQSSPPFLVPPCPIP